MQDVPIILHFFPWNLQQPSPIGADRHGSRAHFPLFSLVLPYVMQEIIQTVGGEGR